PLGPKASTTHALSFNSSHTSLDPTVEESALLQVKPPTGRALGCHLGLPWRR
ncbi:hypothetical protein K443DRAFT_89883, partial [Laccaria amethystina LaAM-08-1]